MYKDWDANPERFQAQPVSGVGVRDDQIPLRAARRQSRPVTNRWTPTPPTRWISETYILQHGHYQIEVMANLDKVPPKGALIVVTWPKVRNGLGFPARAFAILP